MKKRDGKRREAESEKGGRESCVCREGEGSAPPHLRPPEFARRAEERKKKSDEEEE